MHRQFARVYALMILTVIGLLVGAGALFEAVMAPRNSYQLSLPGVFEKYQQSPEAPSVRPVSMDSVQFPAALSDKLQKGDIVPVALAEQQVVYYKLQQGKLLAFGPVLDDSSLWEQANRNFAWLFYGSLALVFLILLFPIGRDILRVQRGALRFADKPQKLSVNVRPASSVYPLANTLEKMSARIVDLIDMQRDLSNTVAHEIRTPLSRMEFVLQQIGPKIDERYRQRLQKDIEEINLLATDYLEFARSQHQQPPLDIRCQPAQVLAGVLKDKFEFYQSQVSIQFDIDDRECAYDSALMQVAAQNLIMNALRYAQRAIHVSWQIGPDGCCLSVADDGAGLMGKEAALKEAFSQGEPDTKHMGFGLGLYITHQIACRHQGELRIGHDETLGGARFEIVWPINPHRAESSV